MYVYTSSATFLVYEITNHEIYTDITTGIATSYGYDSLVTAAGYTGIIESIGECISPRTVSDAAFQQNVALFKNLTTPVYACNLFIPGDRKLVGPQVDEKAILAYGNWKSLGEIAGPALRYLQGEIDAVYCVSNVEVAWSPPPYWYKSSKYLK